MEFLTVAMYDVTIENDFIIQYNTVKPNLKGSVVLL